MTTTSSAFRFVDKHVLDWGRDTPTSDDVAYAGGILFHSNISEGVSVDLAVFRDGSFYVDYPFDEALPLYGDADALAGTIDSLRRTNEDTYVSKHGTSQRIEREKAHG